MKHLTRRLHDYLSYVCLVAAVLMFGIGVHAQMSPSQETINALNQLQIAALSERITRLESGALWLAGALVANLGAHAFQIRGEVRRRRDEHD